MPVGPRVEIPEEEPLLPTSTTSPPTKPPARWWDFWSAEVRDPEDIDGIDEEEGRSLLRRVKSRKRSLATQAMLGTLLLLLGAGVGALIDHSALGHGGDDKHGPLVPPVFKLPPPTGLPRNQAYLIEATHGAVASEDVTCSNLGLSILRDLNGTAIDAAVTTSLCIGLLNGFSSGIGGGGFMLVRVPPDVPHGQPYSEITAIDFREMSPGKSEKEMYGVKKAGRQAAQLGALAIGVPGELRGLEAAHELYGKVPWKELVMPVAELAKGWFVSRELARRIRIFGQFMLDNPTWADIYASQGYLAVEGDWIKRTNYAKTLERIAEEGADAFYHGDIAKQMVETVKSQGGILSLKDLQNYKAISYPAIHQTWNNKTIYTTDAPSSGGVMLGILNILEPYQIHLSGGLSNYLNVHRFVEAMKFAFGARSEVADPMFAANATRFKDFYSKEWADETRLKLTDNMTHGIDYYGLQHDTPIDHGTTHLSVVDQWGGAASMTTTVNLIWGSRVMCPKTGVIFNDEMDDFSVPGAADAFGLWPSPWNYPAPGKRPLSSTAATIVEDSRGELLGIYGGSGGSRIFPSIAQVLLNVESGMNLSAAIERPRVHDQIVPPITTMEVGPEGEDKELIKDLESRGHTVGVFDINMGVSEIQAIMVENGKIWASSDSRKNGVAAGY